MQYYLELIWSILCDNKHLFVCLAFSFSFKGLMDISGRDGFKNDWWNKSKSWTNKYEKGLVPNYKHWYYLGLITTAHKERFIFSSTVLVFITDGWHLLQFFFLNSITIAFMLEIGTDLETKVISGALVEILYAIFFNLTYKNGPSNGR